MPLRARLLLIFPLLFILAACSSKTAEDAGAKDSCPLTEPEWLKPPADAAVNEPSASGYYFVNEDQSIWASAWQREDEEHPFRAGAEGNKVGWFRPAGAELVITGRRLDGEAPPLQAEASCCYPTRFQASGVYFPTEGCWEVSAQAQDRKLSFVVWVEP
jgi:hypothetical protein